MIRRIIAKRESSSGYADSKYARIGKDEESATASWRNVDSKIKRESRDYSTAHFTNAAIPRRDQFYEQFWRIPRRLSRVSSQSEMISSSRALLSRDKRVPLDAFLRLIQLEICLKEFHLAACKGIESNTSPTCGESKSDKWSRTKLWHNSSADFCIKTVDYKFYNTLGIIAE